MFDLNDFQRDGDTKCLVLSFDLSGIPFVIYRLLAVPSWMYHVLAETRQTYASKNFEPRRNTMYTSKSLKMIEHQNFLHIFLTGFELLHILPIPSKL